MEKTIIALQGRANIGKTNTIKVFKNVLNKAFPDCNENLLIDGYDIKAIVEFTCKNVKVKVGIESQGDPCSRLTTDKLKDFILADCDIIVCACRTSGMTVNVIRQVASDNKYNHIFTSTYISDCNQDNLNLWMAQHLLSLVEKIALEDCGE